MVFSSVYKSANTYHVRGQRARNREDRVGGHRIRLKQERVLRNVHGWCNPSREVEWESGRGKEKGSLESLPGKFRLGVCKR